MFRAVRRSFRRSFTRSRSVSRNGRRSPPSEFRRAVHQRSRSPLSLRKRHMGDRENPEKCRVIGVFGLSSRTTERELDEIFGKFGHIEKLNVIYDRKTGTSRGFAFVYFDKIEDAVLAKEAINETKVDGNRIRVEFSITRRAHTPTPGIYLGRKTDHDRHRHYEDKRHRRDYAHERSRQRRSSSSLSSSSSYLKRRRH